MKRCAKGVSLWPERRSFSRACRLLPPSSSLFLSSSLTILKFRPHPSLRKVAPIISIIKTRCTAAPRCLSPDVFPDAFKPTPAAGAFSDQLPFPSPHPPRRRRQLPLLLAEVEDRDGRNGETFDSNVAGDVCCGHGGHDESVHASGVPVPVGVSWLSAIKVAGSDCHLNGMRKRRRRGFCRSTKGTDGCARSRA